MSNLEQPAGDGGTAGVAVLESSGESPRAISDTSQRQTVQNREPQSGSASVSVFDAPIRVVDSEPLERVLDTKSGDLIGTALNVAAESIARGGTVLFLSRDSKNLKALDEAAERAGLGSAALTLNAKTGARDVIWELRRTLQQGPPTPSELHEPRLQLGAFTEQLDSHLHALSREIRSTGVTGYEALSTVLASASPGSSVDFSALKFREWSRENFEKAFTVAGQLDDCLRTGGYPVSNPWRGSARSDEKTPLAKEETARCLFKVSDVKRELSAFLSGLGFDPGVTENDADRILHGLRIIEGLETDGGEALKGVNLRATQSWVRERDEILGAIENELQVAETAKKLNGKVDFDRLRRLDLHEASSVVAAYQRRNAVSRLFDSDYAKVRKNLDRVAAMPERVEDLAKALAPLERLQKLLAISDEQTERWERLFPEETSGARNDLTMWRRRAQVSFALTEIFTVADSLCDADRKTLLGLLKKPEPVYAQAVKIQEICSLLTEFKTGRTELFSRIGLSETEQEAGFFAKPYSEQEKRLRAMNAGAESWTAWQRFSAVSESAREANLGPLVDHILESRVNRPILAAGLKQAWFRELADEFASSRPGVEEEGAERRGLTQKLLAVESEVRDENAFKTAKRHWDESPRYLVGGQSAALFSAISTDSPAATVEEIFSKAPRALLRAKPLLIADPDRMATLAASGKLAFDLVLLDDGVTLPEDHTLRTKAMVRRVGSLTADPSAATVAAGPASQQPGEPQAAEVPKAEWRLPASAPQSSRDLFQAQLKKYLETDLGLTVHTNVKTRHGIADLAICGKTSPQRYELCILLDGANAQALPSSIEREKSREAATGAISSRAPRREFILDWYRHPEQSKREFLTSVQRALKQPPEQTEPALPGRIIPRESLQNEHVTLLQPYRKASVDLGALRVLQRSQGSLRPSEVSDGLVRIVKQEGPIHRDELAQRFLQSCGLRTLSEDMALQIVEGEQAALKQRKLLVRNDFIYLAEDGASVYPRARGELGGTTARFERICPEELEAAICLIVKHSYGISRKDLPGQIFNAFGYKGVPFGADAIVERELRELVAAKVLCDESGVLTLGERSKLS